MREKHGRRQIWRLTAIEDRASDVRGEIGQADDPGIVTEHWVGYFGAAPPPRTSWSLMIRAVAYKMQERVIGGLSAATRRLLCGEEPAPVRRRRGLRPGTVLIREWHGIAHQVTIVEKGVIYRGEHHRSLSEVARLITGARWSGPRFFGVKR